MTQAATCPTCGAPLAPTARAGSVCPRCLLAEGLADSGAPGASKNAPPPTPEELAADLPELEILELVGVGGMGAVYRARQRALDRIVALKVLPAELAADAAFTARFEREAQAMARLSHPNIVAVHGSGRAGARFYLVMEFVEGANLRELLRAGRIAPRDALAFVGQICDALQYAHDQGVVHRDIKPENVLVNRKGRVKIADFGLAKLAGREPDARALTRTEQTMGTPNYMAPEQLERSRDVDHRADIYSLGVVFYELLTGELPLGRFDPPSHRVELDVRLDEVVLKALAREPGRRYQHASEVRTEIDDIAATKLTTKRIERPDVVAATPPKSDHRKRAAIYAFAMSVIAGMNLRWFFDFGIAGAVLSGLLLAAALFPALSFGSSPEMRAAWSSMSRAWRVIRSLAAAALFAAGCAGLWFGMVEGWTRETPDYISSRPNHRDIAGVPAEELTPLLAELSKDNDSKFDVVRKGFGAPSEFHVKWDTTGRTGGFALEHRPARFGALLAGVLLLLVSTAPLVITGKNGRGQHFAHEVPVLVLLGLAVHAPLDWMRALDEGGGRKLSLVREWRIDAGIDELRSRAEKFLANSGYDEHTRVLGTVARGKIDLPAAHYDVLGADIASPFERFDAVSSEVTRRKPHVLLQFVGDLDQTVTVVRLNAGDARADRAAEWKPLLDALENAVRGGP